LKRDSGAKIILSKGMANVPVLMSEIKLISSGTSTDNIEFPLLDSIIRERLSIRDTLNQRISQAYSEFLDIMEKDAYEVIEFLAEFISRIDVLQSKAYVARTYGYCRPEISTESRDCSYVSAEGLRHCLIEQIQTNELYVANDVEISGESAYSGILLYGTNAVGKTSLIRAVGVAVILAQSGMYVPCRKFVYSPYRAIFTRILGNDNLFKGLSMFAVEMSELRVILNSADKYSLVLGDELCSGTETESALSIFMSGLMDLHKKRASFLFATHFHEILKFEEMKSLPRVAVKHMAVRYDMETDCLIYDRLLRDGAGNRLYGLEVAKSLHLPEQFIETAYKIRNTYFPEMRGDLASTSTRYNAKKLRGMCELCKTEMATETHHLIEQKLADKITGFIEDAGIKKDHAANLAGLCEKCHLKIHQSSSSTSQSPKKTTPIVRKKTTKGYILTDKQV
jgi:DNA mismatch repair protein MutS